MRPCFPRTCPHLVGAAGLLLALAVSTTATDQDSAANVPSLARYVPKDDLGLYLESDGLDAHADAWRKTAAYKILNNTMTGSMLESVFVQVFDKYAGKGTTGAEALTLLKHVARSGFVLAFTNDPRPNEGGFVLAIRDGFKNKDVRPTLARFLQALPAPNTKAQPVVVAGHKVISGKLPRGDAYHWWVEESKKDDLVLAVGNPAWATLVLETLDKVRPNAVDLPQREKLLKPEKGFLPTGLVFTGSNPFKSSLFWKNLGFANVDSFAIRWGFQDDALMTETRIKTVGPRVGALALLDGPTFDKGKLPPIPENVSGFTAVSLDVRQTRERLVALGKDVIPPGNTGLNQFLDGLNRSLNTMMGQSKLRWNEEVLPHIGPKVAWYVLPNKAGAAPILAPGMVGLMMAGAGLDQVPRFAMVFEIDDPIAVGKGLDEVMGAVNRELKSQGKPPGEAPAKGARGRGPTTPTPEFKLMSSDIKMYVLNVPPELSSQFPPGFRPAVRIGPKFAVLATSADVARAAIESKGNWTAPNDLGIAFQGISTNLKTLDVSDPRESLPNLLASLPAKLQTTINTAVMLRSASVAASSPPPAAAGPGAAAPPEGPTASNSGGGRRPVGVGGASGPNPGMAPSAVGGPGGPGSNPTPGAPGSSPAPTPLVLQVEPAKMPTADSIKALLFPSLFTIELDGDEIRIVTREAFPSIADPSRASGLLGLIGTRMAPGGPMPPGVVPPTAGPPPGAPGGGRPVPGRSAPGGGGGGRPD